MTIKVQIKGINSLISKLRNVSRDAEKIVSTNLYIGGEEIMAKSKEEYVPVDLGTLRSSGFVELPKHENNGVSVTLGFGGPAAPYAVSVHENPRAGKTGGISPQGKKYKTWSKVGQWKYLEIPFNEHKPKIKNKIRHGLKKLYKKINVRG